MTTSQRFLEMKAFLAFDAADEANLRAAAASVAAHGRRVTDEFYATLQSHPATAPIIDGHVETLKRTHGRWMTSLVCDPIDDAWYEAQRRIGHVHVQRGIPPFYVELTFGLLREKLAAAIALDAGADVARATAVSRSLVKALDMSLAIVNEAYAEERLDRLSAFTGFTRKLIENCINKTAKK